MQKQVKRWILIIFSYACGIAYPTIFAYAMNYLLYSGQARYYVKEFGSSFSEDPGLWVGAIGYTVIFILLALLFIIVLGLNVMALILARKSGMDKKSSVFWWISIAWCILSTICLTFPIYFWFDIGNANNLIDLSWITTIIEGFIAN